MIIKSIDLWTEQKVNHYECFNGAFIDGFQKNINPFNKYKVVKNCNCIITTDKENINITNKHNAIIFYNNEIPVRLLVINKDTEIERCISIALKQELNNKTLNDLFEEKNIKVVFVNMNENPIYNNADSKKEIDVGSCDRWNLLYNMLKGSYTEDNTSYGNYQRDKYEFIPNIHIKYELETDEEKFIIEHKCAFINQTKTRIIPIQENSKLTKN